MAKSLLTVLIILISLPSLAMQMLTDEELGEMTGQAFLRIDNTSLNSTNFTRFTFGMDIDVSLNADLLEFGRYERSGYQAGSSDIRINDFALGSVNEDGTLNPFSIRDPYFEIAFENNSGQRDLVGIRIGFDQAFGKLSGNISYLTGNLEVELYGKGSYLGPRITCGFWNAITCNSAKFLVTNTWGDSDFSADAELINPSNGVAQPVRATHIGLTNGTTLSLPGSTEFANFLVGLFRSQNCNLLGINTCYPLTDYRTLDVGNVQTGDPARGLFISFQTKPVTWRNDGVNTATVQGAFLNIPDGGIRASFEEAFNGIERIRTKFVDPYFPDRSLPGL